MVAYALLMVGFLAGLLMVFVSLYIRALPNAILKQLFLYQYFGNVLIALSMIGVKLLILLKIFFTKLIKALFMIGINVGSNFELNYFLKFR